ncbi:MAG TPA: hypothetical protein EYG97_03720 [Arcobacter sp.]|nr:hypothetical protein [Arcobacter sp.]HIP56111.1 hypothetical protein [Arcobacter sp.]
MNFKIYFNNLSSLQQIQLYIIPLMIVVFVYINYSSPKLVKNNNTNLHINKEITKYKNKLDSLKDENKQIEPLKIISSYEYLANKFKVNILNLSISKHLITIQYKSKHKNAISYLNSLEKISDIMTFDILSEGKYTIVNVVTNISNSKSINTINQTINQNIYNPFKEKKILQTIQAKAIIDSFVMLDGKWYQLNDIYKKAKIIKISKNYITLKSKNKTTILKVFDDE